METKKLPYELLIRWDQLGQLSGAHVQYRFVTMIEGEHLGEFLGHAEPLGLTDFPLRDLLDKAQADTLLENAQIKAKLKKLEPIVGKLSTTEEKLNKILEHRDAIEADAKQRLVDINILRDKVSDMERNNQAFGARNLALRKENETLRQENDALVKNKDGQP